MINMAQGAAYVVRGAKMKCSKGSSLPQINLPASHGSYVNGKPVIVKTDRIVGSNIGSFGVCKCTKKPCIPAILSDWMIVKEDTIIDGKPAVTTKSVLICGKGGQIKFVTDGQD
jgi:hypothetical protein